MRSPAGWASRSTCTPTCCSIPTFPDNELERLRGQTLAAIQQEKAQPPAIISRVAPKLLFGEGHAYSNPASGTGTEEAVTGLKSAELAAFYQRWVRPDNSMLLVVGDTSLAAIQPLLEQRFGGWRAPAEALPKKNIADVPLAPKPRVFLIDRPGSDQSQIRATTVAPSRSDADYIRFVALDTLLGGNFTSRLNMNLREDKHWSYGAGTRITDAVGQGTFRAGGSVQTDKTAESMVEILKELRDVIGTRKPDDAELKFAKDSIAIALPGNNETSNEIANSYAEILTYGLKDSYWNDYVGDLTALTPARVNRVRRPADPPRCAHLGRGGRPVEDREAGARAELRRGDDPRHRRQGGREVARARPLFEKVRAVSCVAGTTARPSWPSSPRASRRSSWRPSSWCSSSGPCPCSCESPRLSEGRAVAPMLL